MGIISPLREPLIKSLKDPRIDPLVHKAIAGGAGGWDPLVDVGAGEQGFYYLGDYTDLFPSGLGDAIPTNTPTLNTGDGDYVGGKSITLTESSANFFEGGGVNTDYNDCHNGNGFTYGCIFNPTDSADATQMLAATFNTVTSQQGFYLRLDGPDTAVRFVVSDGVGGTLMDHEVASVITFSAVNTIAISFIQRSPGTDDWQIWVNGTKQASGEIAGTPSTDPAQDTLRIGVRGTTSSEFYEGSLGAEILVFDEVPGDVMGFLETRRG